MNLERKIILQKWIMLKYWKICINYNNCELIEAKQNWLQSCHGPGVWGMKECQQAGSGETVSVDSDSLVICF